MCLIPEIPFELYGPEGLLEYIKAFVKTHKHFIMVVAEGAHARDVDNNDDGFVEFLRDEIKESCKGNLDLSIGYFDVCE